MKVTADLCDEFEDKLQYVEGAFFDYGGCSSFEGIITTVLCFEDNTKVKEAVAESGHKKVLVIHGGGSISRALVGDMIAKKAASNQYSGIIVNGLIRDCKFVMS